MTRRLELIYVFLTEQDDAEGIAAFPQPVGDRVRLEPMIASSEEKLEQLRGVAQELVLRGGKPMRIAKFTTREDLGYVMPPAAAEQDT